MFGVDSFDKIQSDYINKSITLKEAQERKITLLKNTPITICVTGGRVKGIKLPPKCMETNKYDWKYTGKTTEVILF